MSPSGGGTRAIWPRSRPPICRASTGPTRPRSSSSRPPAGLIERYLVADDPAWDHAIRATGAVTGCAAGIDYPIGDPALPRHGYGTAAITRFTPMTFRRYPEAGSVVAAVQQANVPSWRALEKSGFTRWWSGQLDSPEPSDAGPAHLYGTRRHVRPH